jgi:Uma2 family endonuclease
MPTSVTEVPYRPVPIDSRRKKWTREECAVIEASGAWDQQNLELVEGELISTMGKNRPHTNVLILVQGWLVEVFGLQYVNPETPIDVSPEDNPTSEPQPDLIVLSRPSRDIRAGNPQPAELRLVVEISDSSLGFDLTVKADLYARAGIADYWVVDVAAEKFVVHRNPANGKYQSVTVYSKHESVSPLAAPKSAFRIADAFPE